MPPITVKVTSNLPATLAAKESRTNTRYKNTQIAEGTGISPSIIGKWMKGGEVGDSTLSTACRLAAWLECDVTDVINVVEEVNQKAAG